MILVPKRKQLNVNDPTIIIQQAANQPGTETNFYITQAHKGFFDFRLQIPFGADRYDATTSASQMTFYPNAHPEVTSVDGTVQAYIFEGTSWSDIRAGTGCTLAAYSDWESDMIWIGAKGVTDNWYVLTRGIILFDTSVLPDNCTIKSAILSLYGTGKYNDTGITPDINIYSAIPASNTGLVGNDYTTLGTTAYCDTAITYANWNGDGWNNFTLNAAGLAAISKTGITKIGVRNANYDATNNAPPWSTSGNMEMLWYGSSVAEYLPTLTVNYTIPTSCAYIWVE